MKKNPESKKKYQYLHLVESIRTRKGPRHRLILNLGNIDPPKKKYKELANCIETILFGQMQIFCLDPIIEKLAIKAAQSILEKRSRDAAMDKVSDAYAQSDEPLFQYIDINSFEAATFRSIGSEYICYVYGKRLELVIYKRHHSGCF